MELALPSGFEARLQEMNDTLQQRKQVLEKERQLQSAKRKTLEETNAKVEQIHRMTYALKNNGEKLSTENDRLEKERGEAHVRLEDILCKIRMVAGRIIDLEQEQRETSKFYEKNKEEMEMYHKEFQDQNSSIDHEISELQKEYEELKRSESDRKKQICEVDAAIAEEEERRPKLVSMKEEVIHEIASNSIKAEKLEATVPEAIRDSNRKREELKATLFQRRNEVTALHQQNRYWEDQVSRHIHKRTQMQRDLETLENTIAHTSKALYG